MFPQSEELRILTPVGMLGYGYDHSLFWAAISEGAHAIICDSGSTDSGPAKLALGTMSCPRDFYTHDLEPLILAAHEFNVPIIVGGAGGDGSNAHVDVFVEITREIVKRRGLRSMKVLTIYSEIPKEIVHSELEKGEIIPCGEAVPALSVKDLEETTRVVAQMGYEPYQRVMDENPDFDIIIGGRSYDPAPYVAFCRHKGFVDLGIAHHMGKIMECGALCAQPKSREALAIIRFLPSIQNYVRSACKFEHELKLTTYGTKDEISMFPESDTTLITSHSATIAIHGDARAKAQDEAT
ncbi:hypothetical protein N7462_004131 [Penicillium macrosclerotiorum]|uniref:uncharacterized protein n=1 Tax=Penicillium macrosclerotiorum TaxID=303699 RepID=UPI00254791C2|nr:uncharacterized protein N7462_004131 [Penicillium macrosclerotiorum]KAJ5689739.1 hypothetical protein N7462_004131 [Penicillium macrosclerotiorum]